MTPEKKPRKKYKEQSTDSQTAGGRAMSTDPPSQKIRIILAAEDLSPADFVSEAGHQINIWGPIPCVGLALEFAKKGDPCQVLVHNYFDSSQR